MIYMYTWIYIYNHPGVDRICDVKLYFHFSEDCLNVPYSMKSPG